ncbi:hypothetical protein LNKW23_41460 [Paralimibaculum aggregatum]|uniref:Uncharacterized protein n=1 Tax=Paralimibaculum aggregatum TaxID=3036245 RepID=A0ABQ6LNX1_9RHOB|nr:hypothetical protein [Limibaculum sp. NKW23]GMG84930.1 hypothetical protein LNKW23_41460 [Limibaculum sp. NKW23]
MQLPTSASRPGLAAGFALLLVALVACETAPPGEFDRTPDIGAGLTAGRTAGR